MVSAVPTQTGRPCRANSAGLFPHPHGFLAHRHFLCQGGRARRNRQEKHVAQRTTITLIDDLSGDEITAGAGRTVTFAIDGNAYEIDLTNEHAEALQAAFAEFIAAGRKIGMRSTNRRSGTPASSGRTDPDELTKIREWAAANGYKLSSRGRIAQTVRDAYAAAH